MMQGNFFAFDTFLNRILLCPNPPLVGGWTEYSSSKISGD